MKEKEIKKWITNHKKEIIASGIVVLATGLTFVGVKYGDRIIDAFSIVPEKKASSINPKTVSLDLPKVSIESVQTISEGESVVSKRFGVSEHIRNLPNGMKASPEKVVLSAEKGIILLPGQTLVEAYVKGDRVA